MNNKEDIKVEFTKDAKNNLLYRTKTVWHNERRFTGSSYPYKIGVTLIKDGEEQIVTSSDGLLTNKPVEQEFTFKKGLDDKKYKLWFVVNNDEWRSEVIEISGEQVIYISSDSETESAKKSEEETESVKNKGKRKIRDTEKETESKKKKIETILEDSKKQKRDLENFITYFNTFMKNDLVPKVNQLEKGLYEAIEKSEKVLRELK